MAGGIPVYRFGPYDLDPASGRLFHGPKRVPLADTHFAILRHLASNPGDIVSTDTLRQVGWGQVSIDDNTLRQAIRKLRQILGHAPNGAVYIETLRGHGIRFAARVARTERDAPGSSLEGQIAACRACVQGGRKLDTLDIG